MISYAQLVERAMKYFTWYCFSKYICQLILGFDKKKITIFSLSFCLMKCLSTFTCLVRSCWTRLLAMTIATLLSHYILISVSIRYPSYLSSPFIHSISHNPLVIPLNYVSALDKATTFCFLLFQVTKFPPTKIKYPEVDFLSVRFLTQSTSV